MTIRHPRTTNELRAVEAAREAGVRVRARRNVNGLPSVYSDLESARSKSWKRHRRAQHHHVKEGLWSSSA